MILRDYIELDGLYGDKYVYPEKHSRPTVDRIPGSMSSSSTHYTILSFFATSMNLSTFEIPKEELVLSEILGNLIFPCRSKSWTLKDVVFLTQSDALLV
ncbi:uncharacterized protein EAE97_005041 [Botrytis byssoidea]|uniref:Uncharacterized protein n=1 Tax=Botrytis byssoidea TaxID=139641 RepID=A0A9P5IUA1_9HELO|nr:uncharacterized protein EAE97_005041 [Botrytis byssoidea]KAF7946003.1 hypothetical protein EAE97_005041 [Botrytis byssoidea]